MSSPQRRSNKNTCTINSLIQIHGGWVTPWVTIGKAREAVEKVADAVAEIARFPFDAHSARCALYGHAKGSAGLFRGRGGCLTALQETAQRAGLCRHSIRKWETSSDAVPV